MKREQHQRTRLCGYAVGNEFVYRIWNLFLVSMVLVGAFPVILALYLILFLVQGTPVLYKGVRLGKDRKLFYIYKFRTLVVGAEAYTKKGVLPPRSGLETPMGKFLRESRLDELPQLFNILKGDMNFIGPRPVRPEIAEQGSRTIKNYDIRFSVKPGLVGFAQLFTTHRTPKKIRARLNRRFCTRKTCFWKEPFILGMTVGGMARKMIFYLHEHFFMIKSRISDKRQERRQSPAGAMAILTTNHHAAASEFMMDKGEESPLLDINDEAFTILSSAPFVEEENKFMLQVSISYPKKTIKAHCFGKVSEREQPLSAVSGVNTEPKRLYVVRYTPASEFDFYKIDKSFLNNSILL